MTFKSLSLVIILGWSACLEGFHASTTTSAGPVAYTTIRNTINVIRGLKPAEENITGGHGGRNVDHMEKEDDVVVSNPRISGLNHYSLSPPDGPIVSETLTRRRDPDKSTQSSPVSGISALGQDSPLVSFVGVNSGPSIRISSAPSGVRTISYSAPGGILISHGSPGSSYVVSSQLHRPASYFYSSGGVLIRTAGDTPHSASTFASDHRPVTVSAIHDSGHNRGRDPSPVINLVATYPFPESQTTGVYGNPGHSVVYGNLQMARETVAGISTVVSRALDNLAWIRV